MLEIILFASIAAFFALRLYMMLGRRTGHTPRPAPAGRETERDETAPVHLRPAFTGPNAAGMEAIRAADGVFEPHGFLQGARGAYEMVVNAFAEGDRETLRNLLADNVYDRYVRAIEEREAADQRQVSELLKIESVDIDEAAMRGEVASVTVRFTADIASGVTDAEGQIVSGDPGQIRRVEELWTFERDTTSSDPNWLLARVRQG